MIRQEMHFTMVYAFGTYGSDMMLWRHQSMESECWEYWNDSIIPLWLDSMEMPYTVECEFFEEDSGLYSYIVVYFENEEDHSMFLLTWKGRAPFDDEQGN